MKKISKKKLPVQKPQAKKPSKKNGRIIALAMVNVIAFIAVLVGNYLAVSLPLGGMTTWALADLYPNLFTPAGLTFSIRWLIYLLLTGFVVRQVIDLFKKQSLWITKKIGIRFLLSCITNIGRLFARHFRQVFLSVIVMLCFLVVLIVIAKKIGLGKKLWTWKDKLLVHVPFSIYLGRISVAIIANISARLVHIGRNMRGMSDIFRTILVIIVATALSLRQMKKYYNIVFALVVVRAFVGIIIKRIAVDPAYAASIIRTLGICIAIITAGIGRRFDKWRKN